MDNNNTKSRLQLAVFILFTFSLFMGYYVYTEVFSRQAYKIFDPSLQNILIWTNPAFEPIVFMGKGQETFQKYQCPVINCYVTSDRKYLPRITDFDIVIFHGPELRKFVNLLPGSRSPHQQYVFVSMESSQYYPIKDQVYHNYFNWTWSYKLNSDLYFGYIIIRNKEGEVIGPKKNMHWLDEKEMDPINDTLKEELSNKTLAAAWFVSNCKTPGKREEFAKSLKKELEKYNLGLDIYGGCGDKKCSRSKNDDCHALVKQSYYFYLSFENSFSEDYVTEKLLTALQNNAVPIVYGGANYTRFMPDGAYLNARALGSEKLAKQMADAINNTSIYYNFFKWRNHYSYHYLEDSVETNPYCTFCSKVNQNVIDMETTDPNLDFHRHLDKWWNS